MVHRELMLFVKNTADSKMPGKLVYMLLRNPHGNFFLSPLDLEVQSLKNVPNDT